MYVCVCNKVTDHQIRHAVNNGMFTIDELCNKLNIATCCGECKGCARRILRETVATTKASLAGQKLIPAAVSNAAAYG